MAREDNFAARRQPLQGLSEQELEERFWALAQKVVDPLLVLARENTTASIERSVLLRMGFSSLQCKALVDKCIEYNLLGKGAGHVVWRLAQLEGISVEQAGGDLAKGKYWGEIKEYFAR